MTMESDLQTLLKTQCDRVFADVAPVGTAKPYVTWQAIGGRSLRNLDGSASDKRHTVMQVNVWASSRPAANTLIRSIEDAICASTDFITTVEGEPLSTYEPDTPLFGALQRFSIISER
jgi:hypothetical protein